MVAKARGDWYNAMCRGEHAGSSSLQYITNTNIQRRKRIYILDRRGRSIQRSNFRRLGSWIRRRLTTGVERQGALARTELHKSRVSLTVLQQQWKDQRQSQRSLRACMFIPCTTNKGVMLTLIRCTCRAKEATHSRPTSSRRDRRAQWYDLGSAERHRRRRPERERQGTSQRPGFRSFPHDERGRRTVRCSQCARIISRACRRHLPVRPHASNGQRTQDQHPSSPHRTILRNEPPGPSRRWSSFPPRYVYFTVRIAVFSNNQYCVGTKVHQKTRASIQKRTGPLQTAIRKFNGYCDKLAELANPDWGIAIPRRLDGRVDELKEDPELYEDVWVYPTAGGPPRWMVDQNVRSGIKAMLKIERCQEEHRRLYLESDNLLRWYRRRAEVLRQAIINLDSANSTFRYLCLSVATRLDGPFG